MLIARYGIDIRDIINLLIDREVDVNIQNEEGKNALMCICTHKCDDDIIEKLIEKTNLNSVNLKQESVLHLACRYNVNRNIIKLLIEYGIDVNLQNETGQTALIYAYYNAENNKEENIIQILINAGANVSIQEKNGFTLLQYYISPYASQRYNENVMKMIINAATVFNPHELRCLVEYGHIYDLQDYCIKFKAFCTEENLLNCIKSLDNSKAANTENLKEK